MKYYISSVLEGNSTIWKPKPDVQVLFKDSFPALIVELISIEDERDKIRMISQQMVNTKQAYLVGVDEFCPMSVYVDGNAIATRYLSSFEKVRIA